MVDPDQISYAVVNKAQFDAAVDAGHIDLDMLFGNGNGLVLESWIDTVRLSLDETLFILKAEKGPKRDYLVQRAAELGIGFTEYNYAGILALTAGPDWTPEVP